MAHDGTAAQEAFKSGWLTKVRSLSWCSRVFMCDWRRVDGTHTLDDCRYLAPRWVGSLSSLSRAARWTDSKLEASVVRVV